MPSQEKPISWPAPSRDVFHDDADVGPSNRSFGLVFMLVFALVGTLPWWRGDPLRTWALVVAGAFGLAAMAAPSTLAPLNRVWLRLGLAMHRIVNPLVMGGLFYLVVTPFGLVRQILGKGLTPRLRRDPAATTYWIERAGQPVSRMDQQF